MLPRIFQPWTSVEHCFSFSLPAQYTGMELKPWETWKQQAWGFCDKCKNAHICQAISKGAQLLWEPWPRAKCSGACWRLRAWIQLTLATPTKIPSVDVWQVPRQASRCPEEGSCTLPEPQAFLKMQLLAIALPRTVKPQCCSCFCPPRSLGPARSCRLEQELCAVWESPWCWKV